MKSVDVGRAFEIAVGSRSVTSQTVPHVCPFVSLLEFVTRLLATTTVAKEMSESTTQEQQSAQHVADRQ